jgi:hypothetical protein
MPELFLRPTVIAGETAPDDFEVIWNGLTIGRILKQPAGFDISLSRIICPADSSGDDHAQRNLYRGGRHRRGSYLLLCTVLPLHAAMERVVVSLSHPHERTNGDV